MFLFVVQTHKNTDPAPAPQHGMGAQYLDPAPYVSAVRVPTALPLALPPLPIVVSPDQAQMQVSFAKIDNVLIYRLYNNIAHFFNKLFVTFKLV